MKNILIGIDFQEKNEMIFEKAFEFAKSFKSKIWVLHVAAPNPDFVGYEVGPQYIRDFRADELKYEHKILNKIVEDIKVKGIEADGLLIQGATTDVILNEAEKLNIDMVILGHHEHGFLYDLFFGSVSSDVVMNSKTPVLVIPIIDNEN